MLIIVSKKFLFIIIVIACFFIQCSKRPEYPDVPQIELLEAKKVSISNNIDSLFIRLKFKDGDGNLGMNRFDEPTKEITFQVNVNGDSIISTDPNNAADCENYVGLNNKFYKINRNPNYFNYFVSFYEKKANGYFPIKLNQCINMNGRFSRFDPSTNYSGPLEGEMAYGILISPLDYGLSKKTVQIEIFIQDRSMNKSAPIRSQDITFN